MLGPPVMQLKLVYFIQKICYWQTEVNLHSRILITSKNGDNIATGNDFLIRKDLEKILINWCQKAASPGKVETYGSSFYPKKIIK